VSAHFVIIGNGAAGYRAAKAIRRADSDAQVTLITEESYPFYLRRQLGEFLAGGLTLPELIFQSRNAYRRERIDLLLGTRVDRVDLGAHEVILASPTGPYGPIRVRSQQGSGLNKDRMAGQSVRYDRLLLATGTRAVPFYIPGTDLRGVAALDTLEEAQAVKPSLGEARQAAILGEGVIGLALAESLLGRGLRVTQLLRGERFWPEMLDEHTGAMVERVLENAGVVLRRHAAPRAIIGAGGRAIGVETTAGETVPAELVAVGCRRRPAIAVIQGSGIAVRRGIQVDVALRTSQADIFAAGDVAEPAGYDEFGEEGAAFCWQRAWAQGGLAAATMLDRKAEPAMEAVRVRTAIFGRDLAVIGRGHLAAQGGVTAEEHHDEPSVFRRLVFDEDLLVGAVVFGTGESVHELSRLVAAHAPRHLVQSTLGLAAPGPAPELLPETFARHCPICAAELVVRGGTAAGAVIRCQVCSTDLVVRWDGRRGWLDFRRL
jgi:NAD(P)H-nitrite reductase large subunit